MYPPSARGHVATASQESGRSAESYYTSHEPPPRSGWQALYSNVPEVHFTASMLPPNARGYSPAPHESTAGIPPTRGGTATPRLQSQWIARSEFSESGPLRHRFYGRIGRGYGAYSCGPFLGFGFCGAPFFYGYFGAGLGCMGGSYWGPYNWASAPTVLNLSPCLALAYEPDEDQVSANDSAYGSDDDGPATDAAPPADENTPADNSSDEATPAPAAEQRPVTLLQLKDGSMYGLTRYWVAGGMLNYVTDYGARNAVPFDRIDIAKTVLLNSQRGVPFILQTGSASH